MVSDIEYAVIQTVSRLTQQVDLLSLVEKQRLYTALTNYNELLHTNIAKEMDEEEAPPMFRV